MYRASSGALGGRVVVVARVLANLLTVAFVFVVYAPVVGPVTTVVTVSGRVGRE